MVLTFIHCIRVDPYDLIPRMMLTDYFEENAFDDPGIMDRTVKPLREGIMVLNSLDKTLVRAIKVIIMEVAQFHSVPMNNEIVAYSGILDDRHVYMPLAEYDFLWTLGVRYQDYIMNEELKAEVCLVDRDRKASGKVHDLQAIWEKILLDTQSLEDARKSQNHKEVPPIMHHPPISVPNSVSAKNTDEGDEEPESDEEFYDDTRPDPLIPDSEEEDEVIATFDFPLPHLPF
jgi:hypothetical protein